MATFANSAIAGRVLHVLYGSQTGTAQDVAEGIGREAERFAIDARVSSLDEFGAQQLADRGGLVVLVVSTTGQGTTPDNMKLMYRTLLRKSLPADTLARVRFALFGLGDSSYAKYNAVARRLWVRLQQLGALPLLTEPGLGDDQEQQGYDAALGEISNAYWAGSVRGLHILLGQCDILAWQSHGWRSSGHGYWSLTSYPCRLASRRPPMPSPICASPYAPASPHSPALPLPPPSLRLQSRQRNFRRSGLSWQSYSVASA